MPCLKTFVEGGSLLEARSLRNLAAIAGHGAYGELCVCVTSGLYSGGYDVRDAAWQARWLARPAVGRLPKEIGETFCARARSPEDSGVSCDRCAVARGELAGAPRSREATQGDRRVS